MGGINILHLKSKEGLDGRREGLRGKRGMLLGKEPCQWWYRNWGWRREGGG